MSAVRRKSTAAGVEVAEDEVRGGGVVAVNGVPAAYSRFSEDDGGGDWKQVPEADVAGRKMLPPLPLIPLVIGTSNGGRDCRKRSPPATIGVCDTDPASWNTDRGGGCDGTATPTCRCCCC